MSVPTNTRESSANFDLFDLLQLIWNRKFSILLLAICLMAPGFYYVMQLPKEYTATGSILLASGAPNIAHPAVNFMPDFADDRLDTYMEFIDSRQFLAKVVKEMGLASKFNLEGNEEEREAHAIDILDGRLQVSQIKSTEMLKVSYSDRSPRLAAEIVNHIGPSFFDFYDQMQRQRVSDSTVRLNVQVSELNERVVTAEQKLQEYLDQNAIIDVDAQSDLIQTKISTLMREMLSNDRSLSELTQTRQMVGDLPTKELLKSVSWIAENPLVQEILRQVLLQEKKLAEVAKRYLHKHPKYITEKSSLDSLNAQLDERVKQIAGSIQQKIAQLNSRQVQLEADIAKEKLALSELSRQQVELAKLNKEVESAHTLYELFLSRLQESEVLKDTGQDVQFAVVDYAIVPQYPAKPRTKLLFAMIAFMALATSAAFWVMLQLLNNKLGRLHMVVKRYGVSVLAHLPKERSRGQILLSSKGETSHIFAEAIREIRTSLLLAAETKKRRLIAITSIQKGHGKATVAANLAQSFSNMEPVMLSDVDLQDPSIASAFGLPARHPGIRDLLEGESKFTQCVHYENNGRLAVLAAGRPTSDPAALLSTAKARLLLAKLAGLYKRIVLDAPPVHSISDALLLSKISTGIVLVCDVDKTTPERLSETLAIFQETNAPLLGVVFNRVRAVKRAR